MNRFFYLLASALFFFACSGDNSTSLSEYSETTEYQHVSIDKENHRIIVNQKAHTKEYCILHQGTFNWGKVYYDEDQSFDMTTYEIHGDTLVIFFFANTDNPHYYIGGSTDKIYGEWKNIDCNKNQDKISCESKEDRDFREQYDEIVLIISENDFQEKLVYKSAYFKYNDYMNSAYLLNLYAALENDYATFTIGTLGPLFSPEQESYIKAVEKDHNIEVLEQTKRTKKFKLGGKIYDVNITDIERDSLDYRVAISVKSDEKECSYEERQTNATEENCRDLTTEGMQDYIAERDFQDSLVIRGTIVNTKELDDFEKCIKEIAVTKDN